VCASNFHVKAIQALIMAAEGVTSMKLKSLAVITLFVLGCSAAFAQGSFTLGFATPGGEFLMCDYEQIQYGGYNNFYMQGIDNITDACSAEFGNATVEGVKISITPADGSPVLTGPAYAYADNVYDAFSDAFTGAQWFVITQTKPSKLLKHYGWAGYLGIDGYEFLADYGYLTSELPGSSSKPVLNHTAAGAALQSQTRTKTIQK
jgi:hypothetical protein